MPADRRQIDADEFPGTEQPITNWYCCAMRPTRPSRRDDAARAQRGLLAAVLLTAAFATAAIAQGRPQLTIIAPEAEAELTAPEVTVRLHAEDAIIGGRSRDGTLVLLQLDQLPPVKSYAEQFTFRGVKPGRHRLEAELRRADGEPFDPPVKAAVSFTLVAPTPHVEP